MDAYEHGGGGDAEVGDAFGGEGEGEVGGGEVGALVVRVEAEGGGEAVGGFGVVVVDVFEHDGGRREEGGGWVVGGAAGGVDVELEGVGHFLLEGLVFVLVVVLCVGVRSRWRAIRGAGSMVAVFFFFLWGMRLRC